VRSGITLIELIVGFTLTVLLVGLLFQFLVPALKISKRTTLRAEVQQQAILALREIVNEMEQTSLYGISFSEDAHTVAVHPIVEVTRNSQRVYADHLIIYKFDPVAGTIHRGTWRDGPDPSIESPRKLSQDELANVEPFYINSGRTVVREVEEFSLTHSGTGNLLQLPLLARMKMREQEQSGSRSFELVRAISLRNQQ
jgi:type II secretory pathway pseudopilin PulG